MTDNVIKLRKALTTLIESGENPISIADKLRVSRSVVIGWSKGHYVPMDSMAELVLEELGAAYSCNNLSLEMHA